MMTCIAKLTSILHNYTFMVLTTFCHYSKYIEHILFIWNFIQSFNSMKMKLCQVKWAIVNRIIKVFYAKMGLLEYENCSNFLYLLENVISKIQFLFILWSTFCPNVNCTKIVKSILSQTKKWTGRLIREIREYKTMII